MSAPASPGKINRAPSRRQALWARPTTRGSSVPRNSVEPGVRLASFSPAISSTVSPRYSEWSIETFVSTIVPGLTTEVASWRAPSPASRMPHGSGEILFRDLFAAYNHALRVGEDVRGEVCSRRMAHLLEGRRQSKGRGALAVRTDHLDQARQIALGAAHRREQSLDPLEPEGDVPSPVQLGADLLESRSGRNGRT